MPIRVDLASSWGKRLQVIKVAGKIGIKAKALHNALGSQPPAFSKGITNNWH